MSHDDFEAIMKVITKAVTTVYQSEVDSFYNVSDRSSMELKRALSALQHAAENMDGE